MERILVPGFIQEKVRQKKYKGYIKGSVLSLDIKGFTSFTEQLVERGKEGVEILSDNLNRVFTPLIDYIYSNGGWITGFAGDAFTAVFRNASINQVGFHAINIRNLFNSSKLALRKETGFKLGIRLGLGQGRIYWCVIKSSPFYTYYFKGKPISQSLQFKKENITDIKKYKKSRTSVKYYNSNIPNISSLFVSGSIIQKNIPGEFRDIVSIFIGFNPEQFNLTQFITTLTRLTYHFGGYLNKINFQKNRGTALVMFGAPITSENYIHHALKFTLELKKQFKKISVGITAGKAFAGFTGSSGRSEYTCLGKVVNLAARILSIAQTGKIYTDNHIQTFFQSGYQFHRIGKKSFKGFDEKIPIFEMVSTHKNQSSIFHGKIISREKEKRKLKQFITSLKKENKGTVLFINGKSGIGKSRLIQWLNKELDSDVFNWFHLLCDELIRDSFNPFIYFIREYFNQLNSNSNFDNRTSFNKKFSRLINRKITPGTKLELNRTKEMLMNISGIEFKSTLLNNLDSKQKYENTILAIKNLIKAESELKPTILYLDDAQWIDPDSVNLVNELSNILDNIPTSIIIETRTSTDSKSPEFNLNCRTGVLHIRELSTTAIEKLAQDRLKSKPSKKLLKILREKSEGNPFYIEQILKYMDDSGILFREKGEVDVSIEDIQIPDRVNSILIARIDRLGSELANMVKTASVLGREFSVRVLSEMLKNKPISEPLKILENEAIWKALNEFRYIFSSALIRDAAYEMQLKKILKDIHNLAAETIEKIYRNNLKKYYTDLAYHYENAGKNKKASKYTFQAAEAARKDYRNLEAIRYYKKFLKLTDSTQEQSEAQLLLGLVLEHIGEWKDAEKMYNSALVNAEKLKDPVLEANCRYNLGNVTGGYGQYKKAIDNFNKAYTIFQKEKNNQGIINVLGGLGIMNKNLGFYEESLDLFEKQLKLAGKLRNHKKITVALGNLGILYFERGEYQLALKYFKKQQNATKKVKDKFAEVIVLGNLGMVYQSTGDFDKAKPVLEQFLKLAMKFGDRDSVSHAYGNLGVIYKQQGDYETALEYYNKLLEISRELGDKHGINIGLGNLGNLYESMGNLTKAMELYEQKLKIAMEISDKKGIVHAIGCMGSVYESLGDYKNAMKSYRDLEKFSKQIKDIRSESVALCNMGALYWNRGNFKKAEQYLLRFLEISGRIGDKINLSIAYGNMGELYKTYKKFKKADTYYKKAVKIAEKLKIKYLTCSFYYHQADILFEDGKFKKAEKLNNCAKLISDDINRSDVQFDTRILHSKILAQKDKKETIKYLEQLLLQFKEKDQVAEIYFHLFLVCGLKQYGKKALKIFEQIVKHTPKIQFKNRIKFLNKKLN